MPATPNAAHFILPVEVQHRELRAKLLLAADAASRGANVIVGDQREIVPRISALPPSVYLDKSIARTKARHFQRLNSLGHVPVATCEEGLVYRHAGAYIQERIHAPCFELVERFFTWGEHQQMDVTSALGRSERIVSTGNPRFDLLRPELRDVWSADADALRKQHGRFVIINSSFSRFNRVKGTADVVELLRKRGTLQGDHGPEFYRGWTEHLRMLLDHFVKMVPALARALPQHTVIVRPHPSEDHGVWQKAADGLDNVRIIHEGSAIPWMVAAEAVIHNSCTTGVEAWLLDRPVLAFLPVASALYDSKLPNELSERATASTELVQMVEARVRANEGAQHHAQHDAHRTSVAAHYIAGLQGPLATQRMVEQMLACAGMSNADAGDAEAEVPGAATSVYRAWDRLRSNARRTVRTIPGFRAPAAVRKLARQKFPGASAQEVQQTLDQFARLLTPLQGVRSEPLPGVPNTFRVWRP